ncbi:MULTISPECIES: peroxidase [unclassified Streptomyces]|uniref:Dyp-type peroxidase n=1 Tax=unclassified Streptomyces TaxID=2593676 RepID=UPI001BE6EA3E|nr:MULTISPECIES: peroxidase [unclassified Streptomyces]MBT2407515.1 peroxidase [Streptomyces sp. ISL-21]MBT2459902.1 peroxidase [Streptomyces sp. ISL-86]MBT2608146.1 peroxidase [Streptomyces sp. ISL-87]
MVATLELDDIQGLVPRGYSALKAACFLMLTIADPASARPALGQLALRVTSGRPEPSDTAVNVAVTSDGMRLLGLESPGLDGFSEEFVSGMTDPHRSRFLGDVGENAPRHWRWGGPATPPVHVLALLYARDEQTLDRLEAEVRRDVLATGALVEAARLGTAALAEREPFGFRDGISQPLIEGLPKAEAARTNGADARDVVKAGEFVLGYPNEYGLLTDRPLLPPPYDSAGLLPRGPGGTGADLGRNGSYLVFRQLHQDVDGFRGYLDDATRRPDGTDDPAARDALAARMVGRWPSGAPLVHAPRQDDPGLATDNDFGYFATDPNGLSCPLGAHIRRANPRDSLDPEPGSAESLAIGRRHRILRRGRAYGPGGPGAGSGSGLHFLCLNANISRQFEFIQHTWLNNPNFNGLYDSPDPLVAPRLSRATFTEQARPVRTRHADLPQFVSVQGGAYFFLPGLKALRYLCAATRGGEQR